MPEITREEVAHLARLARLALDDAELDRLAGQLDVILGAVAQIAEVTDAADVPPTSHAVPLENVSSRQPRAPVTAANAIVRHTQVGACLQRVMSVLFVSQAGTVLSGYCAAISALGFLTNSFSTGSLASNTRLKNPTIISSQLCSPHATSLPVDLL